VFNGSKIISCVSGTYPPGCSGLNSTLVCTHCDASQGWNSAATSSNECTCATGYTPYPMAPAAPTACYAIIFGCVSQNQTNCLECNASAKFQVTPVNGQCICASNYYPYPTQSNFQNCTLFLAGCLDQLQDKCRVCNNFTGWSIKPTLKGVCECAQNYIINTNNNMCFWKSSFPGGCMNVSSSLQCF